MEDSAKAMIFHPIYYADWLEIVNPTGDIGFVTLWTPLRTAKRLLAQLSTDILNPALSRVACIANLYGDGVPQMMCNLLYNPVPPEYSIEWLTCAIASKIDVVMVGLPGAAQDRLPASPLAPQPRCPSVPRGPGEGC